MAVKKSDRSDTWISRKAFTGDPAGRAVYGSKRDFYSGEDGSPDPTKPKPITKRGQRRHAQK